jgi:hypothetical protein
MEMLQVAFWNTIPECELIRDNARITLRHQAAVTDLVMMVNAWLLDGHKKDIRTERDVIEFPVTPWEFVKQRYAPKWFLNRFPIKMKEHEFRVAIHHHYVCPHVKVDKAPVHYAWMGKMSGQIKGDD